MPTAPSVWTLRTTIALLVRQWPTSWLAPTVSLYALMATCPMPMHSCVILTLTCLLSLS